MSTITSNIQALPSKVKTFAKEIPGQTLEVFNFKQNIKDVFSLNKATKLILLGMLTAQVIAFIYAHDFGTSAWIGFLLAICAEINLALVDQGKITNFSWGIIATVAWLIIAIENHTIGDMESQTFYFIMQFIGISVWHRNLGEGDEVIPKKLNIKMFMLFLAIFIAVYGFTLYSSIHLGGRQILLDSLSLPLAIVGQIMMTYGYREQWFVWNTVNLVSIIVWYNNFHTFNGGGAALSLLVLNIMMLINSIYATVIWMHKETEHK